LTAGITYSHIDGTKTQCIPWGFRTQRGYDPAVRVPDVVLKSVGYICETTHKTANIPEGDPYATGFFVSVPSIIGGKSFMCFVTAKHVANDLRDRRVHFKVNKIGGGTTVVKDVFRQWFFHPTDNNTDVAVVPITPHREMDFVSIPTSMFVNNDVMQEKNIGIGDEVFMTGLFTPAEGSARILPIVRHGNIAMLPEEQIQTELGFINVYLVEARSIGGVSGSPVFVRETIVVEADPGDGGKKFEFAGVGNFHLLGLMHGHWDIRESEMNSPIVENDRRHGVNMGIGIVVPASKILETINSEAMMELRKQTEERARRASIPGMDSAREPKEEEQTERPFTRADFEHALAKASRKLK